VTSEASTLLVTPVSSEMTETERMVITPFESGVTAFAGKPETLHDKTYSRS